ncbi:MAG: alpha/beta hydrolase [Candidatus Eremiobacteraeota bacterium]|nr:alpha/beta hydrolase [Candidatus Eremiobacteraeota bacterium]
MQIVSDDTKLEVRTGGSGDAVVLLHGFPFSSEVWKSQIETLSQTNFVVAPDLRGLGKSAVSPGPYLMESLAGDLAAVLDALGVERASIVGHSLGGYVAMAFFRMFSERVLRLAFVCSRIDADPPAVEKARLQLAEAAESSGTMQPILDFYGGKLFAAGTNDAVRRYAREIMEKNDPFGAAAMLRGMAARVTSEDLIEELTIPVLLVTGGHDALSPAGIWDGVIPGAQLVVCENSAHVPMLEEPKRLTGYVESFLRSRDGRN